MYKHRSITRVRALSLFSEWIHYVNLHLVNLTFGQLLHLVNCYQASTDTFHPTTFGQLIQTHTNLVNFDLQGFYIYTYI